MADGGQSELPPKVYPVGKTSNRPQIQQAVKTQLDKLKAQHPGKDDEDLTHHARDKVAASLVIDKVRGERQKEKERAESAEALTMFDALTGLPNRRWLDKEVEVKTTQLRRDEAERRKNNDRRAGKQLYAVFFDIDHFKWVNEQYGHAVGDNILRGMSKLKTRAEEPIARYGGEEFVQLAENLEELQLILERYTRAMQEYSNPILENSEVKDDGNPRMRNITFSYGVAIFDGTETGARFLERADQALRKAKDTGRNKGVLTRIVNGQPEYEDIILPQAA